MRLSRENRGRLHREGHCPSAAPLGEGTFALTVPPVRVRRVAPWPMSWDVPQSFSWCDSKLAERLCLLAAKQWLRHQAGESQNLCYLSWWGVRLPKYSNSSLKGRRKPRYTGPRYTGPELGGSTDASETFDVPAVPPSRVSFATLGAVRMLLVLCSQCWQRGGASFVVTRGTPCHILVWGPLAADRVCYRGPVPT